MYFFLFSGECPSTRLSLFITLWLQLFQITAFVPSYWFTMVSYKIIDIKGNEDEENAPVVKRDDYGNTDSDDLRTLIAYKK